jgi:glycine cleavage system H protein
MGAIKKGYPLIPGEEQRCTWMSTGLVSYKLCDRDYRCDICPFERAIKNEAGGGSDFRDLEEEGAEGSQNSDWSAWINDSFFYHPDHCWVQVENPEYVRIGIGELLTQLMTDVKVVILPQVGSYTGEGEYFAHIIQADYILPVISPLSGSVQTVNPRLKREPGLITDAPRGDGWLVAIKPKDLEGDLKNLLFGRKALAWYRREEKEIIARTELMLKRNPEAVGPTMQDGGVRIGRLQDMLGFINSKQRAVILDSSISKSGNRKRSLSRPAG